MIHDSGSLADLIDDIRNNVDISRQQFVERLMDRIAREKAELKVQLDDEYNSLIEAGKDQIERDKRAVIEKAEVQKQQDMLHLKKEILDDFMEELGSYRKDFRKHIPVKGLPKSAKVYVNENDVAYFKKKTKAKVIAAPLTGAIIIKGSKKMDFSLEGYIQKNKKEISRRFFDLL